MAKPVPTPPRRPRRSLRRSLDGFLCPETVADEKSFRDEADRGECQLNEIGVGADSWRLMSVAIDSGAAETVIPHRLVTQHQLHETNASRGGLRYSSATGQPIPNLGEQKLQLLTLAGAMRGMTFRAAPVSDVRQRSPSGARWGPLNACVVQRQALKDDPAGFGRQP